MRKTVLPVLLILLATTIFNYTNNSLSAVERVSHDAAVASVVAVTKTGNTAPTILTRVNFDEHIHDLYEDIGLASVNLDYGVFRLGMVGYYALENEGALNRKRLLTIIDFSKPSTAKRFFTIDLRKKAIRYNTYVAHGRNTGENMATRFSNIPHSNQSSLGFYVTGETYVGSKGYSLRLDGKEESFNDKIRSRAIVMHAADYATAYWLKRHGRLGRSQGCPALPPDLSRKVIDDLKNKSAIFTYYPDKNYLNTSEYLDEESLFDELDKNPIPLLASEGSRL